MTMTTPANPSKSLLYFRFFSAAVSLFGMGYRLIAGPLMGDGLSQFLDMLGYFTIQSGLIVLFVFLSLLIHQLRGTPGQSISPGFRGGALLYITVTSLVYLILLDKTISDSGLSRVVLYINHLGTAVLLWIDCLISLKPRSLTWKHLGYWLLYPLAYLLFSVAEGLTTGRFRYYFLNFKELGIAAYAGFVLMMLLAFTAVGTVIILSNRLRKVTEESK